MHRFRQKKIKLILISDKNLHPQTNGTCHWVDWEADIFSEGENKRGKEESSVDLFAFGKQIHTNETQVHRRTHQRADRLIGSVHNHTQKTFSVEEAQQWDRKQRGPFVLPYCTKDTYTHTHCWSPPLGRGKLNTGKMVGETKAQCWSVVLRMWVKQRGRGRKDTVTVDSQQVNRQPPAERVKVLNDGGL